MSEQDDEKRKTALAKSRRCRHCGGDGLVSVYRYDYAGKRVMETINDSGECIQVAGIVAAHCTCAYGQWMRETSTEDVVLRTPTLRSVLDGETDYQLDDPSIPDAPDEYFDMTPIQIMAAMRARFAKPEP